MILPTRPASALVAALALVQIARASPETPRMIPLAGVPAVSGMVPLRAADGKPSESRYLVVHDSKRATVNPPIGLLSFSTTAAPDYRPLRAVGEDDLNDVEAIAPVPGRPGEYLLMESGGGSEARRLVPLRVGAGVETAVTLDLAGAAVLKARGTRDGRNVESLIVLPTAQGFRVYYAHRDPTGDDRRTLRFLAADLDQSLSLAPGSKPDQEGGSVLLPTPLDPGWRICTDVVVNDPARPTVLYVSAAIDEDVDFGPFASRLYRCEIGIEAGRIVGGDAREIGNAPGFKIEALCIAGASGRLLLVTDDEFLGAALGALRPEVAR